jgi:uncharacterized membrane protein
MDELVILSFDTPADADEARITLQQIAGDHIVVLPDLNAAIAQSAQKPTKSPDGLRGWVLLPWRVGSKALGGALTAVTWTSLLVGAVAGGLAGRLLGIDEESDLRHQLAQAVQPDKTPVILLARGEALRELIDDIAPSRSQVYRTRLSADAATRIQAALDTE